MAVRVQVPLNFCARQSAHYFLKMKIKYLYLLRPLLLSLLLPVVAAPVWAQRVSVKTNALYWATASPNLGAEFRLNRHLTLNLEAMGNKLHISDYDTRVLGFTPEVRYWFSARPQAGHFLGLMGGMADYNIEDHTKVYKGDAYFVGPTYGYSFVLGRHWSLEATIGVGAMRYRQKRYDSAIEEAPREPNDSKWIAAPLKLGLSFVYIIK